MNINKVSNLSFGYNKRLNKKLVERLKNDKSNSKINNVLLEMNSGCNTAETSIKKLIKNYDKNEIYLDVLLKYFISAKVILCSAVDRLFPDLNFTKNEIDTYDKEITEKAWYEEPTEKIEEDDSVTKTYYMKPEYNWLEILNENLAVVAGNLSVLPGNEDLFEDYDDYDGDDDSLYLDDISNIYNGISRKKKSLDTESDLVQKFVPMSHSPKSINDVVGLDKSVNDIKNFIIFPLENPKEAKKREEEFGIDIPHFIVFNGPPGCGKTMLAEAIAAETKADMYKIDLSNIGSSYVNGTVINISNAFDEIYKISKNSEKPVIVFMDEMDSILFQRTSQDSSCQEDKKVLNTMLPIIASAKDKNIIIIGATNMYDTIDKAVKRRIDMNAYIGLPKEKEIKTLLNKQLGSIKMGKNLAQDEKAIEELSEVMLGYSPANIINIVKSAQKECFVQNKEITKQDIISALQTGSYEKIKENEYMPESMQEKRTIGFSK